MNIVLVCIKNFQEYILSNIEQLLRLNHKNIYVLTNKCFFERFIQFNDQITLVNVDNLIDTYDYYSKTNLDKGFRNGFWPLASLRFFYIYEFMRRFNVNDVIHLENDVLIYYNCDEIMSKFDKRFMYIPFDTLNRNIASIIYIPTADIFKNVLDNYENDVPDMYVFNLIQKKTGLIQNLPIFIYDTIVIPDIAFVSQNYDNFKFIFDAAAMGQFLGGVDPQNINPQNINPQNINDDTCGFVNEMCIIKYNNYEFYWIIINDVKKPFIKINEQMIPVFNLHIHCKNLKKFM